MSVPSPQQSEASESTSIELDPESPEAVLTRIYGDRLEADALIADIANAARIVLTERS